MKKAVILSIILTATCTAAANAQVPGLSIISSVVKKVITALDLKVQQLQNQTIWLQNAEKQLENNMSLGNLNDISGWVGKERDLYQQYYQELASVKKVIADYDEVRRIVAQQSTLVGEYKIAYALFGQDRHFSRAELSQMGTIYNGLLQESIRNLDEALLAVNSFQTQMTDADRLKLIHQSSAGMQKNLDDLRSFNNNNARLSLQRAKDEQDRQTVKTLYGIH
jgi:hypothetical protein